MLVTIKQDGCAVGVSSWRTCRPTFILFISAQYTCSNYWPTKLILQGHYERNIPLGNIIQYHKSIVLDTELRTTLDSVLRSDSGIAFYKTKRYTCISKRFNSHI